MNPNIEYAVTSWPKGAPPVKPVGDGWRLRFLQTEDRRLYNELFARWWNVGTWERIVEEVL